MGRGYCQDPVKPMNDALRAEIARGMAMKGKRESDVCRYAGFSESTWCRKKRDPGILTLNELRNIFKATGASNETILEVFGRRS